MVTKWPIVPSQNWHYFEGETKVEAETFEQLADNLASYRAANHLPAGDPQAEIEKFVAARWPHVMGLKEAPDDSDAPKTIYGKPEVKQLAQRVGSWCYNRFSLLGAIGLVSEEVAQQREGVCISCPCNSTRWKTETIAACPGCRQGVEATELLAYKLRRGRETQRQSKLGACTVSGQENGVAVHLDAKHLKHRQHYLSVLPSHCWLLKLSSRDTSTASAQTSAAQT